MNTFVKSALAAVALSVLGAGSALAAECACCKDGAKMECCDKAMTDKAPKPQDGKPAAPAPEHKH